MSEDIKNLRIPISPTIDLMERINKQGITKANIGLDDCLYAGNLKVNYGVDLFVLLKYITIADTEEYLYFYDLVVGIQGLEARAKNTIVTSMDCQDMLRETCYVQNRLQDWQKAFRG